MPSDQLPANARRFLARQITSVMQLELVLTLHRDRASSWTPDALAGELRAPVEWIVEELTALSSAGLTRADDDGAGYRIEPAAATAAGLEEIAAAYPRRRTSIINLIFSPASG